MRGLTSKYTCGVQFKETALFECAPQCLNGSPDNRSSNIFEELMYVCTFNIILYKVV